MPPQPVAPAKQLDRSLFGSARSNVSINDGNLEDLNEILCVRVQPFPSTTETLKISTKSSTVTVFNRFHP